MKKPFEIRFMTKIKIDTRDKCWIWTGTKRPDGYGVIYDGNKKGFRRSHVVSYELFFGDRIENGKIVMHICDNPSCVNPHHLQKGTKKENTHDMISKNRGGNPPHYEGERNPKSKLCRQDVLIIRELLSQGFSQRKIAKMFNVNRGSISCIHSGRNWGWLKENDHANTD